MQHSSKDVARAAITIVMSNDMKEEQDIKKKYDEEHIRTAAVNIGGNLVGSISKILESALVCGKRNQIISDEHVYDGALAGAVREALQQVMDKSVGFNAGGKIGIARSGEHLAVCIYLSIGLLHLDEIVIELGHRVLPKDKK